MSDPNSLWLLFGPSGVGKSCFGQYLECAKNWLFLEIDQFKAPGEAVPDGIDVHGLRVPWDQFYCEFEAHPLAEELTNRVNGQQKSGCVLSFPSRVPIQLQHIASSSSHISLWILYGSAADCIHSFLEREKELLRNLDLEFWRSNNYELYLHYSLPHLGSQRVAAFDMNGSHRRFEDIFSELDVRSAAV
jgi:hypothetical protein